MITVLEFFKDLFNSIQSRFLTVFYGSDSDHFGSLKSGMTHSLLLKTNFGSVENGMIHTRSFLLSSWFNKEEQSRDRDGTDCETGWQVKFSLVEREC